jgi:REP element-mobilizing transposase RayT
MARTPRSKTFDPNRIGVYHCTQRCVRRAFLCGNDPATGKNYEHRRAWIRDQLEKLAGIFAFEFLTYSVLSNHLHTVVRNRPDLADAWSHEEVARRWWKLYPQRRNPDGSPAEMTPQELKTMLADRKQVAEWRRRLKSISWLMKSLAEPIAKHSNAEDEVRGHFWQDRFRCRELTDEGALLACCIYADLNPLRAGLARSLETALYTSIYDRLRAQRARSSRGKDKSLRGYTQRHVDAQADGWLTPLHLDPNKASPEPLSRTGRRLTDRGFLDMTLEKYCALAEWTWRNHRREKPTPLPEQLAELLRKNGIKPEEWEGATEHFDQWFGRCVGRLATLEKLAKRQNHKWLRGMARCRQVFVV